MDRTTPSFYLKEIISIVFAAPFIALYILLILSFQTIIEKEDLLIGSVFLTIIPLITSVGFSIYYGVEWDYRQREKRMIPLALINLPYIVLCILWMNRGFPEIFLSFSYLMNGLVSLIITRWYKISIHIIGIAGPSTYLLLINQYGYAILFYMISIIVAFSRIKLKRHSMDQVISGYLVSITTTVIGYVILLAIYNV
ncbi:MAG: hypothetical protein DRO40_01315 [Thermoprotei archaeon]|nr:MAG: hypothetical protein DRO40_01315 [Thermoprotei archaeon]